MDDAFIFLNSIIRIALDKGLEIGSAFLDIMKTFDTFDYVLEKGEVCGIRGKGSNSINGMISVWIQHCKVFCNVIR